MAERPGRDHRHRLVPHALELNLKIEVDKLEIDKIDIKTDFNVYNKEKEVIEKRKYIY